MSVEKRFFLNSDIFVENQLPIERNWSANYQNPLPKRLFSILVAGCGLRGLAGPTAAQELWQVWQGRLRPFQRSSKSGYNSAPLETICRAGSCRASARFPASSPVSRRPWNPEQQPTWQVPFCSLEGIPWTTTSLQ